MCDTERQSLSTPLFCLRRNASPRCDDASGDGAAPLRISCMDMGGKEVMVFPLATDADNAERLRNEFAKVTGKAPCFASADAF